VGFVSKVTTQRDEPSLVADVRYVFRVAYRLTGNRTDAEDLTQDVCEQALRKAPEFATDGDCRRWLLRVLYNRFVDTRRHRMRSPVIAGAGLEPDAETSADASDPEDLAAQSQSESALVRAWARLDASQQMLLLLRAEGHELGDIARIAQIDKAALSSRLYRARASLARYLEEEKCVRPICAVQGE